jgi:uncharacterized Zn-binding protein involved in type VI secretion
MGKIAAKQGDKITATDTHILLVPSPGGPVPTPTPMPFVGTIMSGVSTDVFIEGKPAATVDSVAMNMPPHIPAAGPFQKPPTNQGKIMVGSTGVFINGKPAARQGDMAMTCNDPADLPIGQVVAVGTVFIGETGAGAPTTSPSQTKQAFLNAKWGQQGTIVSAEWQEKRARIGDEVKLIVQSKDFEDGTPITFLVWERQGSKETILAQIDGEIQGNKAEAKWKHMLEDSEEKLEKEVQEEEPPKYYFVAEVEGDEKASGALEFTYSIDIYLEDEDGNPLDNVKYVVTLSDGTKKKGKFKNGHAKMDDTPYGTFSLEIEGYELAEEQ